MITEQLAFSAKEISKLGLGSQASIYKKMNSGDIPFIKFGQRKVVPSWWVKKQKEILDANNYTEAEIRSGKELIEFIKATNILEKTSGDTQLEIFRFFYLSLLELLDDEEWLKETEVIASLYNLVKEGKVTRKPGWDHDGWVFS